MAKPGKGSGEEPEILEDAPFGEGGPIEEEQLALADVVEEVGKDVVRFTMLTRKPEAQMDFDFAKVVEASKDNPVFYVQYAHARIRSTLRKALTEGIEPSGAALARLGDDELALVKIAAQFPREVEAAAKAREPHRIAFYLHELASAFHAFWNMGNDDPAKRIIVAQDRELTGARLFLAVQIGQVIRNGLAILGVQVGAYSSREAAETGWSTLSARIESLQGRNHRVLQGTADSGTIYRLQALAGTASEAETLCRTIKSQGGDCQVKR